MPGGSEAFDGQTACYGDPDQIIKKHIQQVGSIRRFKSKNVSPDASSSSQQLTFLHISLKSC